MPKKSMSKLVEDAAKAGVAASAAQLVEHSGGTTVVVPVVVINTGTIVMNREMEWEGGDTEG